MEERERKKKASVKKGKKDKKKIEESGIERTSKAKHEFRIKNGVSHESADRMTSG